MSEIELIVTIPQPHEYSPNSELLPIMLIIIIISIIISPLLSRRISKNRKRYYRIIIVSIILMDILIFLSYFAFMNKYYYDFEIVSLLILLFCLFITVSIILSSGSIIILMKSDFKTLKKFLKIIIGLVVINSIIMVSIPIHEKNDAPLFSYEIEIFSQSNDEYCVIIPVPMTKSGLISELFFNDLKMNGNIIDFQNVTTNFGPGLKIFGIGDIHIKSYGRNKGEGVFAGLSMQNLTYPNLFDIQHNYIYLSNLSNVGITLHCFHHGFTNYVPKMRIDTGWNEVPCFYYTER